MERAFKKEAFSIEFVCLFGALCAHILVLFTMFVALVCVYVSQKVFTILVILFYIACFSSIDFFLPLPSLYMSLYFSLFLSPYHHAYFVSVKYFDVFESPNRLVLFCCMSACNVIPSSKIDILELFENCKEQTRDIEKWLTFLMHTHSFVCSENSQICIYAWP